jgi:hypothetical protein
MRQLHGFGHGLDATTVSTNCRLLDLSRALRNIYNKNGRGLVSIRRAGWSVEQAHVSRTHELIDVAGVVDALVREQRIMRTGGSESARGIGRRLRLQRRCCHTS